MGFVDEAEKVSNEPYLQSTYLLIRGKKEELYERVAFEVEAYPDDPWVLFEGAWYYLLTDAHEKGIDSLSRAQVLFEPVQLFNMPDCSPAIELAWAAKQTVNDSRATELKAGCSLNLEKLRSQGMVDPFLDYLEARLAALNDQSVQVATKLESAIDLGWRQWWTKNDPLLSSYLQDEAVAVQLERPREATVTRKGRSLSIHQLVRDIGRLLYSPKSAITISAIVVGSFAVITSLSALERINVLPLT